MAGKKGMKHARPKTREERDEYALNKIEHLLDNVIDGEKLSTWDNIRMQALKIRYDKLRATRSENEINDKRSQQWWTGMMQKASERNQQVSEPKPVDPEPVQETPIVH